MARSCRARRCSATTGACPCSRSSARWRPKTGTTSDDGKRGGGASWPSDCSSYGCVFTRAARRAISSVSPIATIRPIPTRSTRSAIVAIAILALAQHSRGSGLMLIDAYGEIADDVLIEAEQALDLDHRLGRGGNVQEREMSLAVLLDAEGKRLQTPRLDLGDGAAQRGDLGLDLFRQRLDLLLRDVLAHQEDMLIKSHVGPFQFNRVPRGALRARERLEPVVRRREHGRTDNRGPAATLALSARPSVQPPAGRNEAALIQRLQARGKEKSKRGSDLLGPALWLHVNDPGLRNLIGSSTSRRHIGQGFEFRVLGERLQELERVLAGAFVSSSQDEVALGRGKMSPLQMMCNVRGRRSAGFSGHGSFS